MFMVSATNAVRSAALRQWASGAVRVPGPGSRDPLSRPLLIPALGSARGAPPCDSCGRILFSTGPRFGLTVGMLGVLLVGLRSDCPVPASRGTSAVGYLIAFVGFSWAAITGYLGRDYSLKLEMTSFFGCGFLLGCLASFISEDATVIEFLRCLGRRIRGQSAHRRNRWTRPAVTRQSRCALVPWLRDSRG